MTFGKNMTVWKAHVTDQLDYWITADDTPARILQNYTEVTGRAPAMPSNVLCKMRYRTQDEVLNVAREYHRRGIPLDVIVIDFFHWKHQPSTKYASRADVATALLDKWGRKKLLQAKAPNMPGRPIAKMSPVMLGAIPIDTKIPNAARQSLPIQFPNWNK